MLSFKDPMYDQAKQIKLGTKSTPKKHAPFQKWIESQTGQRPLAFDITNVDKSQRLDVLFEYQRQLVEVQENKGPNIEKEFADTYRRQFKPRNPFSREKHVFCLFDSFERHAMAHALSQISNNEIENLKQCESLKDLWMIYRHYDQVTIFLNSEPQAETQRALGYESKYAGAFFNLLERYDTFNYRNYKLLNLDFMSKELLDSKYKGSLFYWSR